MWQHWQSYNLSQINHACGCVYAFWLIDTCIWKMATSSSIHFVSSFSLMIMACGKLWFFSISILDKNVTKIVLGGGYLYTKAQSTSAQNAVVIHSFIHSEPCSNNISCLWSVSFWAWPNRLRESPFVIWHPWIYFRHKSIPHYCVYEEAVGGQSIRV